MQRQSRLAVPTFPWPSASCQAAAAEAKRIECDLVNARVDGTQACERLKEEAYRVIPEHRSIPGRIEALVDNGFSCFKPLAIGAVARRRNLVTAQN
jgi:hypothetical protein